jgi:hypothetical protein
MFSGNIVRIYRICMHRHTTAEELGTCKPEFPMEQFNLRRVSWAHRFGRLMTALARAVPDRSIGRRRIGRLCIAELSEVEPDPVTPLIARIAA